MASINRLHCWQLRTSAAALVAATLLPACASSQLRIETSPEGAEVAWVRPGQSPQSLGKTPLRLSGSDAADFASRGGQLQVAKEGFQPESILVPSSMVASGIEYRATLKPVTLPNSCTQQANQLNEIARSVAESQQLIYRRRYAEAETLLLSLTAKFGSVSVIHDFLGNLYYLQKDLNRAQASYRRSLEIEPGNGETRRMLDRINQSRGGDRANLGSDGGR